MKMADSSDANLRGIKSSFVMPIAVSLWALIGPILVFIIPTLVLHWSNDYLSAHSYIFGTIAQSLMDLPAVILFIRMQNEPGSEMCGQKKTRDRLISLTVGIAGAVALGALRYLAIGHLMGGRFMGEVPAFTQSLGLAGPWNIVAAGMALLAYGPGEAIFVVYLMRAFDKATGNPPSLFSWGVIITSIVWALPHIFNVFFYGLKALPNVLIMFFVGIIMGILLKKTRSWLGPVLFWTLTNGTSL
jgi:hypothetical protein